MRRYYPYRSHTSAWSRIYERRYRRRRAVAAIVTACMFGSLVMLYVWIVWRIVSNLPG